MVEIILVDELPTDLQGRDIITRMDDNEVIFRSRDRLWVAQKINVLDAEVIE